VTRAIAPCRRLAKHLNDERLGHRYHTLVAKEVREGVGRLLGVAVQVAFESKILNQENTFQVQGLKPGAFMLKVN
jgi:hypothetical protein